MSKAKQTQSKESLQVTVPYGWKREHFIDTNIVYYVSPSGHILTSPQSVQTYVRNKNSCKCFLARTDQFNFSIKFESVECHEPPKKGQLKCLSWMNDLTEAQKQEKYHLAQMFMSHNSLCDTVLIFQLFERSRNKPVLPEASFEDLFDYDTFQSFLMNICDQVVAVKERHGEFGGLFTAEMTKNEYQHLVHELLMLDRLGSIIGDISRDGVGARKQPQMVSLNGMVRFQTE